jgi:hypothetical protein
MTQFHEGQEVEVNGEDVDMPRWEKAKIVRGPALTAGEFYEVQFPDGTRAVFDAEHIKAVR